MRRGLAAYRASATPDAVYRSTSTIAGVSDDYQTRLARARRIQAVILMLELSAGGAAALVVGLITRSFGLGLAAFGAVGALFVVIGSLAWVLLGGYLSLRRRPETSRPQG